MLILRARQGNKTIAEIGGPESKSHTIELHMIEIAMRERREGAVTIQRQKRCADPNPDGKWYWKRHFLIDQFD